MSGLQDTIGVCGGRSGLTGLINYRWRVSPDMPACHVNKMCPRLVCGERPARVWLRPHHL